MVSRPLLTAPIRLSLQTAAFEYQFGALDDKQDELKEVMKNFE